MHDTSHTSQHPDISLSPAHTLSLLDQKKRNLVNQRNFRTRRKQYVTELEEKLHAYQQAGVSATKQVQAVARAVAEENAVLRRFVREGLGWSEARLGWEVSNAMGVHAKEGTEWQQQQQQQQQQQEEVAVVATSTSSQRQPLGHNTFEQRREYSSGHRHREFTPALTPEMPAHVQSAEVQSSPIDSGVQSSPANCCTTSKPDTQRTNTGPIHTDTLTPDDPSSTTDHNDNHDDRTDNENENEKDIHNDNDIDHEPRPQPPPTTTPSCMSCEQAATILSELRAPPNMTMDMDQIRQELGCSASLALATCRVTHEKLFQKLDDSV